MHYLVRPVRIVCSVLIIVLVAPASPATAAADTSAPKQECSTLGATDDAVQVRVLDDTLAVVSKRVGEEAQCALVRLPQTGKVAIVRDGVAYVSLSPKGLAIVDLSDSLKPRYDRTAVPDLAITSMHDLNGVLWTAEADGHLVRHELKDLQPTTRSTLPAVVSCPADDDIPCAITLRNRTILVGSVREIQAGRFVLFRVGAKDLRKIQWADIASATRSRIPFCEFGSSHLPPWVWTGQKLGQTKACYQNAELYLNGQKVDKDGLSRGPDGALYARLGPERRNRLLAGGIVLGSGYLLSLLTIAAARNSSGYFRTSPGWMGLPVVGSYVFAGLEAEHAPSNCSQLGSCEPLRLTLNTIPATIQVAGLIVLSMGLAMDKPRRILIHPASIASGQGLNLSGSF